MRKARFLLATVVAMLAPLALANGLVGKWTITFEGAQGTRTNELTVVEADDGYTGSLVGQRGTTELASISVDGESFSFSFTMQTPAAGELAITYSGTVSGDTMSGNIETPMGGIPFTGVREG